MTGRSSPHPAPTPTPTPTPTPAPAPLQRLALDDPRVKQERARQEAAAVVQAHRAAAVVGAVHGLEWTAWDCMGAGT